MPALKKASVVEQKLFGVQQCPEQILEARFPVLLLGVIATAIAYTLGISGVARLRPSFASLVGLAEVLFAVLAAWLILGEKMTGIQVAGGAVVLLGLALARQGDRSTEVNSASRPDAGRIAPVAAGSLRD